MKSNVVALIALAPLFLAPLSVAGAQSGARDQLDVFSMGLATLHARFSQVVIDADSKVQDRSEGEVWLKRPDRFRWAYGGDFPELVIADGERIWIYDEVLEQVTVKDQSAASVDSPLSLLTEPSALEQQFEVRDAGDTGQDELLELRSRNAESEFDRILIGLSNNRLTLMILEDAFGLRTEIRFSEVDKNPDLDDELFRFKPPEGVDVIGDLPDRADRG